jgi:ketosteroid isomerase-like protein
MKPISVFASVALTLTFLSTAKASSQTTNPTSTLNNRELVDAIAAMDARIFDIFNSHNLEMLMSMFTEDLEFYQDNDGLKNYRQCSEDFRKLFANNADIKRELVKDSLEVYPIKDYGAIEIGAHRFCHTENGRDDCGSFRFVMVWRKIGDSWKVSRVVSYGH